MMEEDWNDAFYDLFREAVGRYHEGHRNVDGFFTDQEIIFLSSIGCRTRELFDFVETYARTGEPSPTTMGDDIIYCCENDRRFFRDHGNIHPADFLRVVWAAGDSDPKVYDYVRQRTLSVSSAVPDNEQT